MSHGSMHKVSTECIWLFFLVRDRQCIGGLFLLQSPKKSESRTGELLRYQFKTRRDSMPRPDHTDEQ